jgi:hypothetical protein
MQLTEESLQLMRLAIHHQIQAWELALVIAERMGCEVVFVADEIHAASISHDKASQYSRKEFDDFAAVANRDRLGDLSQSLKPM